MTGSPRRSRRRPPRWGWAPILAACLVSCAPRHVEPPVLDAGRRQFRYRTALEERERRSVGVHAEVSVWVRGAAVRDLPGATARLLLAGPDAFRMRVASAFGTSLDIAARGDTLTAYAPRYRAGIEVEAAGESLGLRRPGRMGCRILGATWHPPAEAWAAAAWSDSLLWLRWTESGDTLVVSVGSSGLPVSTTLLPGSGTPARAWYRRWAPSDGLMWPELIEIHHGEGDVNVTCRIRRVRFAEAPDRERLAVQLPSTADRLTPGRLGEALRNLGRD